MGIRLEVRSGWQGAAPASATYQFDQTRIVVGRASTSDIWLPHAAVGRLHLTIQVQGVGYQVTDEGSLNGTFVNGTRIAPNRPKQLRSGDVIEAGGFRMSLQLGVPVANATTGVQTGELARELYRCLTTESDLSAARFEATAGPQVGETWSLPSPPSRLLIGRDPNAEIALTDEDVSREHAEITCSLRGYHLRDRSSKNGTWLRERQVHERWLQHGDEITLGDSVLAFVDPLSQGLHEVEHSADAEAQPMAELNTTEEQSSLEETTAESTGEYPAPIHSQPPQETSQPTPRRHSQMPAPSADALIFAMAGVLIALSIIAMVFLLK